MKKHNHQESTRHALRSGLAGMDVLLWRQRKSLYRNGKQCGVGKIRAE